MRTFFLALLLLAGSAHASSQEVGNIDVDIVGNDIVVRAMTDPAVSGVTCHMARFERSVADRVFGMFDQKDPFEDPSNTALSCRQTGPLSIGNIKLGRAGEEVFTESVSLVFKQISVRRIYDCANDTLVYVSHGRRLTQGSAKMALSVVPLYGSNVTWANGKPACNQP